MKKNRLGKGLDALLSDTRKKAAQNGQLIESLKTDNIEPNPFQPREDFDRDSLEELAESIKKQGIIQPVTVRTTEENDNYQLVSGERRLRAARMVELDEIPAIIDQFTDQQMMEVALIENLQREDLNPIEEAQAYKRMLDDFEFTQQDVAERVGKSRSSISNTIRLLNLAPKIQKYVSRETLSMGHARSLLSIKDEELQVKAADHIIKNHLSVRETEKYVSKIKSAKSSENNEKDQQKKKSKTAEKRFVDKRWLKAEKQLSQTLNTRVKIKKENGNKVLSITCDDYEVLQRILSLLDQE